MLPDQRRKWHNQRKRAVENFQDALGTNKKLADLTKADALKFRKWWQDRVGNDIGIARPLPRHLARLPRPRAPR
jgi:hypothetical protein